MQKSWKDNNMLFSFREDLEDSSSDEIDIIRKYGEELSDTANSILESHGLSEFKLKVEDNISDNKEWDSSKKGFYPKHRHALHIVIMKGKESYQGFGKFSLTSFDKDNVFTGKDEKGMCIFEPFSFGVFKNKIFDFIFKKIFYINKYPKTEQEVFELQKSINNNANKIKGLTEDFDREIKPIFDKYQK